MQNRLFRFRLIFLLPFSLLLILGLKPTRKSENFPGSMGKLLNGAFSEQNAAWKTVEAFSENLPVPLWIIPKSDSSGYFFTERGGSIYEIDSSRSNPQPRLILSISDQVFSKGDGGLMDIVLHPDFGNPESENGGFIYVNYIFLPPDLKSQNPNNRAYHRISRFEFKEDGLIEPSSELVLVQMYDRDILHTGGSMFFDNEGFLNISIGDEGGGNDVWFNANTMVRRLFAGIIRIDVDMDPTKSHAPRRKPIDVERPEGWPEDIYDHYFIPNTNPWQSPSGEFLEEFVIIGLRNPHTTYYDAVKDEIWVADVGEKTREEISLMKRGDNGQWPFMEGTAEGPRQKPPDIMGNERPPLYDYGRDIGRSVIGGFVYRGQHESLNEKFIFGDFATRNIWALDPSNAVTKFLTTTISRRGSFGPVSFVEGVNNEILVVDYGTLSILELVPNDVVSNELAPQKLSQVGAFDDLQSLTASTGILPYSLTSELYSDKALKRRWVAIPNDGQIDSTEEQASANELGELDFPRGTVFIKHFELPLDLRNPEETRKLETRFLVVTENKEAYGVTYKWNREGTDAELLDGSEAETYEILDEHGEEILVNWVFPSRQQCLTCHTANAGYVLGPTMQNLNRPHRYESESTETNQLRHWQNIGLLSQDLELADFRPLYELSNEYISNEEKVRSYLQANCSFCHRPGGVETEFDARITSHLEEANLVSSSVVGRQSLPDNSIIAPGDTTHSEMLRRIQSLDGLRMPPLGTGIVDQEFVSVLKEWILELDVVSSTDPLGKDDFIIYPNPLLNHELNIRTGAPHDRYDISIFDLSGLLVKSFQQVSLDRTFIVPLSQGVYVVEISDGSTKTVLKLVKN